MSQTTCLHWSPHVNDIQLSVLTMHYLSVVIVWEELKWNVNYESRLIGVRMFVQKKISFHTHPLYWWQETKSGFSQSHRVYIAPLVINALGADTHVRTPTNVGTKQFQETNHVWLNKRFELIVKPHVLPSAACAWFLEIALVRVSVCVCVCVRPRGH